MFIRVDTFKNYSMNVQYAAMQAFKNNMVKLLFRDNISHWKLMDFYLCKIK